MKLRPDPPVIGKQTKRSRRGGTPAAERNEALWASAFDGVRTLAVLGLGGRYGQPHLLAHCTGQEATNRMRLPASGFHQLLRCGTARPFEQVQDVGGFAPLAGAFG